MKRFLTSFLLITVVFSCIGTTSAVDAQPFRASLTLSRYFAEIFAGDGTGEVTISYDVKASKPADSVGVETIEFFTEDGDFVTSVSGSTRNGLIKNDNILCAGDFEYDLPSGESYYAEVTVFAHVGSNYDSLMITTSTIRVR